MIESNPENVEEIRRDELRDSDKSIGIKREPSFSGWFDEDGIPRSALLQNEGVNEEEFDFKLYSVQPQVSEEVNREILYSSGSHHRMEHIGGSYDASANGSRNQNEFVPFDIESRSDAERYSSSTKDVNHVEYNDTTRKKLENPVSAADILKTLFFILVWYTFSTFLTLYNKTLLGDDMGKFPAPLLMNTIHFSMQAVLSKGITWFWSDRFQPSDMSWKDYFVRVVPTALSTAMDVNLSNLSLVFISVTFATMCKSAAPIFLLIFAFAFRLESPSFKLLGIMTIISVGILLTVAREAEFEFWGFIFVMLAAVMSGFRWTMTQILLQKEAYAPFSPARWTNGDADGIINLNRVGLKNPLTLMSYVTPIMAIATGLLSLLLDPWHEFRESEYFNSSAHILRSGLLMLFGGTLAFFMVLTEYILVSVTSAVTVTIAGVVKEAVTILVAVLYFHDEFTWMKGFGLLTIMAGVSLFNWYKYDKLQKGETPVESPTENATSKYAILDEMDEEEDVPLNPNQ